MSTVGRARTARAGVLLVWLALAAALLWWQWTGPAAASAVTAALTVGPLLLPLPGLWRGRRYTFRWAAMTLVPAMAWSLTELVANPAARGPAILVASLGFLALAMLVAALRTGPAAD